MKRRARISIAAVIVAASVPALANAPSDQYGYFNRADTEIVDRWTTLKWERNVTTFGNKSVADNHCTGLGGGYRLPTAKELLTLVDEDVHQEFETNALVPKAIDPNAFPRTPGTSFWTATMSTQGGSSPMFWGVDFRSGNMNELDPATATAAVRCVR